MRHADVAMYIAKGGGKDGFHIYHARATPTDRGGGEDFDAAHAADELDRLIAAQEVTAVFQPIVEIDSAVVIGYEALARGPEGSPLQRPDRLFAAAGRPTGSTSSTGCAARPPCARARRRPAAGPPRCFSTAASAIGSPCPAVHTEIWDRAVASSTSSWRSPSGPSPTGRPSSPARSPTIARRGAVSPSTTSVPTSVRWRCCRCSSPT